MAVVLCVPYGRNEATLAALQLQRLLEPLVTVRIFTTSPRVAMGVATEHTITPLSADAVQALRPIQFVVWLGPAQEEWVGYFYALGIHQKWFPDLPSLQHQACLADRMDEILCGHKAHYNQAKQWLRTARKQLRLLYWAVPEDTWHWPAGNALRPVLDLTCGGYRTASPLLLQTLNDWTRRQQQPATVLYDQLNGMWRHLLRRLPPTGLLQARRVLTHSARRLEYSLHGVWLGIGLRPHLGILACEARALGLFPLMDSGMRDIAHTFQPRPCLTGITARGSLAADGTLCDYLTTITQASPAVVDTHFTQLTRARQLEFDAYWAVNLESSPQP